MIHLLGIQRCTFSVQRERWNGGLNLIFSESIEYIVVVSLSTDRIISRYPIVSECSTSSCRKCVISFRGRESRGPFPPRQYRMQTGGGEATKHSAPQSLKFPVPSKWKTPSEHRGTSTSLTTDRYDSVAGTDWALWKTYNPLRALRGNRN